MAILGSKSSTKTQSRGVILGRDDKKAEPRTEPMPVSQPIIERQDNKKEEERKIQQTMREAGIDHAGLLRNANTLSNSLKTYVGELDRAEKEAKDKQAAERKKLEDFRRQDRDKLPVGLKQVVQGLDWLADKTKPAADVAQQLYTPGGGLTAIAGLTKGAGFGIAKAAPNLVASPAGRLAQFGLQEAAVGTPLGAANVLAARSEPTGKEILEGAAYGGIGGGVLGAGGKLAGNAIKAGVQGATQSVLRPTLENAINLRGVINEAAGGELPDSVRRVVSPSRIPEVFPERYRRSFGGVPTSTTVDTPPIRTSSAATRTPSTRLQRGNISTQLEHGNLSDDVQSGIRARDNSYERITNASSVAKANENLKNIDAAEAAFLGNSKFSPEHIATGNRLLQELDRMSQVEKDPGIRRTLVERALNVSEKLASDLTTAGQTAQAAAILKRLSPEGQLMHLQRVATNAGKEVSTADAEIYRDLARSVQDGSNSGKETADFLGVLDKLKAGQQVTDDEMRMASAILDDAKKFIKSGKGSTDRLPKEMRDVRTRDKVVNFLNEAEQAALARIKARRGNLNSLPLGEWADHAIVASAQIARGTIKAATYVEDLVRLFGEEVRPHAEAIYKEARKLLGGSSKSISEGKVGEAKEAFERLRNSQTTAGKVAEKFIREGEIKPGDVEKLRNLAKQLNDLRGKSAQEADMQMQAILNKYQKASNWDRIQTIRYISMLFNTSTQAVNAISGPLMATTNYAADLMGGLIDIMISGLSKGAKQRTTQLYVANPLKFMSRYIQNLQFGVRAGFKGVSPSGITGSGDIRGLTFKGTPWNEKTLRGKIGGTLSMPLSGLERSLGAVARGTDYAAYKTVYTGELERQAKLAANRAGLKGSERKEFVEKFLLNPSEEAVDIADKIGKNVTFQRMDRWGGKLAESFNTAKFKPLKGFANVVMPFVKTPVNIAEHAIDLTPIGLIRGLNTLRKGSATNAMRREAVQKLGLSLGTGAGLSATGYYLNQIGLITSNNESGDKDVDKLKESVGQGKYRLNVDGLGRYFQAMMSGKGIAAAEKASKYRNGDEQWDYNRFQPLAFPLAAGASLSEHESKGIEKQLNATATDAFSSLFSMSALQGIQSAFQADMSGTWSQKVSAPAKRIVESFIKSFSPSLLNQEAVRRDDTVRQVSYNENMLKNVKEYFMSRTPELSKQLPAKVDVFGNEFKRPSGIKGAYLNPYRSTVAPNIPTARKLSELYDLTGDKAVAPAPLSKSVEGRDKVTGQPVTKDIPKDMYNRIQKKLGDLQITMIDKIPDNLTPEQKVFIIKKIYEFTRNGALMAAKNELGIKIDDE